jgi:hypothetical protein
MATSTPPHGGAVIISSKPGSTSLDETRSAEVATECERGVYSPPLHHDKLRTRVVADPLVDFDRLPP